jgi:probable F420-dependent oxidoreductase
MTEVAGEVADGMIAHGFTTRAYMEQVTLPALARGLAKSGRRREDFQLCYPAFVVSGRTEEEMRATRRAVRKQVAFYGSTPAYRGVLEQHGWGELQDELNAMSKRGLWDEMGERIGDDVLAEFATVAEPQQLAEKLLARYGGKVDRMVVGLPFLDEDQQAAVVAQLKAA